MSRLRVLLAAEEAPGLQVLKALGQTDHEIVAVLTGRADSDAPNPVRGWADRLGVPTLPAKTVKDVTFADRVRDQGVDLFVNVHSIYIAAGEVVDAPRIGSFNVHPGPLPECAGLNPVSWAIHLGLTRHAVTVHRMESTIDTGDIAHESRFDLTGGETALALYRRCLTETTTLVGRLVADAASPRGVPARAQDLTERRYYGRKPPNGGQIDWSWSARQIERFTRACDYGPFPSPWGRPTTRLDDTPIEILRTRLTGQPSDAPTGTITRHGDRTVVACGDEWLGIERVKYSRSDAAELPENGRFETVSDTETAPAHPLRDAG